MHHNAYAARIASQPQIGKAHDVGITSKAHRDVKKNVRGTGETITIIPPPSASTPLARLGRAILEWLDKEDDRVALI